jgi:osmotically-inducible protein OsmY
MFTTLPAGPQARLARPGATPCRFGVAELAESRLRGNGYLALKNVTCTYDRGVLTLAGWLPTYYLKQLAQEVVAGVDGVEQVVNQIEVVSPGRAGAAGRELCRA